VEIDQNLTFSHVHANDALWDYLATRIGRVSIHAFDSKQQNNNLILSLCETSILQEAQLLLGDSATRKHAKDS